MKILWLILAGIAGGILGGMGMGGGTLLIPILTIFLKIEQHMAQWINLVTFIPMSIVALIIHIKNKLVDKKYILLILVPALIAAAVGSGIALESKAVLLGRLFGGFLVLLGIVSIIILIINHKKEKKENKPN